MSHMTALDLLQCFFWSIGGVAPLVLTAVQFGPDTIEPPRKTPLWLWFAVVSQVSVLVAAYKAGGGP